MLKPIFVTRIQPFSAPWVLAHSLLRPVYFWKAEGVSASLLRRLHQLDPDEISNPDEWAEWQFAIYEKWRSNTGLFERHLARPYGRLVLQLLTMRNEEACLGEKLAETGFRKLGLPQPSVRRFRSSDWLWDLLLAAGSSAKQLLALLRACGGPSLPINEIKIFCAGISPAEVPAEDDRLDFAFLVSSAELTAESILYLLPEQPGEAQARYLEQKKIRWISRQNLAGLLSRWERIRVAFQVLTRPAPLLQGASSFPSYFRLVSQGAIWEAIFKKLPSRIFLSSVSASWPDSAEMAAANLCGLETFCWHYSANNFGFYSKKFKAADHKATWSFMEARHQLVWTEGQKNLIEARVVEKSRPPIVHQIGPIMCGQERRPEDRKKWRDSWGVKDGDILISLFDVPTLTKEIRLKAGWGPNMYSLELLETFFSDAYDLFLKDPRFHILLKPKKSFTEKRRLFASKLQLFLGESAPERKKRIHLVPNDLDPYIPVCTADLCLAPPFCSPILAGRHLGIPGYFYDPLSLAGYALDHTLLKLVLHTPEDLLQAAQNARPLPMTVQRSSAKAMKEILQKFY